MCFSVCDKPKTFTIHDLFLCFQTHYFEPCFIKDTGPFASCITQPCLRINKGHYPKSSNIKFISQKIFKWLKIFKGCLSIGPLRLYFMSFIHHPITHEPPKAICVYSVYVSFSAQAVLPP